jgi:GNAT superfamily N-acetyltransferase
LEKNEFSLKDDKGIELQQLIQLYQSNGWVLYTKSPEDLVNAIKNSLFVLSIWKKEKLIGLIRIIGDGITIIYIQDILVLPEYQNNGLGKVLMNEVLKKYRSVRQKVLLAQNEEYLDHFYTSIGFSDSKLQNCTAYVMQGS